MRIWLFLESLKPLSWCVRFGNHWKIVNNVEIKIPMRTKRGKNPPHGYLVGEGQVSFKRGTAMIGSKP